ncbi:alcohol dehydrogenase GroES-like domain-containing protein [Massariosphaeria phaeospora]|uniref:Alcohol dehydrogenase GroES-like domain-containing protein n=1 Tax=Massariosphaeria phaeospora TaxID=100035 RepID=A0A7C8I8T9_9PLEO|nr:alcohol dehydrogenase GroES-like domain-containing protein [Massariosphaeria phaeospora]
MVSEIPESMRALQIVELKQELQINEIPVPKIGDNDVLIKVAAAGYCHTDYQVWEGVFQSKTPLVPSHEPVGTIVAVGLKASAKWNVGQRVGVLLFRHQCGSCMKCKTVNDVRFCENIGMAGVNSDGGMAEYMVGDADTLCSLPDAIPFEQGAPLMCAGSTVWGAIKSAKVPPGAPVGFIGIGGLGSLGVQFAKALGHPVVAIDSRPEGRELATEFKHKADLVIDSNDPEAATKIKEWAGEGGLPGVVVCTDNVPVAGWSLKLLKTHGVCVPLGVPADGLKFSAFDLHFGELTIVGSLVASPAEAQRMLNAVAQYGIQSHVTVVPFEQGPDLLNMYMDPHLKGRLVLKVSG